MDTPITEPSKKISISNDELNIKIWYNDAMKWLGLASEVDGNKILYKRVQSKDTVYEDLF